MFGRSNWLNSWHIPSRIFSLILRCINLWSFIVIDEHSKFISFVIFFCYLWFGDVAFWLFHFLITPQRQKLIVLIRAVLQLLNVWELVLLVGESQGPVLLRQEWLEVVWTRLRQVMICFTICEFLQELLSFSWINGVFRWLYFQFQVVAVIWCFWGSKIPITLW